MCSFCLHSLLTAQLSLIFVSYFVMLNGSLVSHTWQAGCFCLCRICVLTFSLSSRGRLGAELVPPASLESIRLQEARAVFLCEDQRPPSCRSPPPAVLLSLCGGPRAAAPGYRLPVRSALLNVQFREFNKCIERAVQPFSQSSPQLLPLPQQTPCFQPQPQATTDLPVSMNLSFKDISCNWNHIVSALVSHPFYRSVCE